MVNTAIKRLASPALDPLGNRLFGPPLCGRWGVRLHGDRSTRRIALTFDDGPVEGGTERVLDALADLDSPGTFFFLGANTLQNPKIVERTVNEGHVVGNHSMHHSRIDGLSFRDRAHFVESDAVFRDVIGRSPRLYRSPWGWTSPWEVQRLRRHGLVSIGWEIYPHDDEAPFPDSAAIARRVIGGARPGAIVLLHDGYTHARAHEAPELVKALRVVIPALRASGFQIVTVPDLLGLVAYKHEMSEESLTCDRELAPSRHAATVAGGLAVGHTDGS